ncbi:MAG TPA: metallophosphoesterase family protein, partial [Gemmataceae bacterium]|nr:metallophosphoesterase family protein [Gemmataceae bacterium]
GKGDREVLAQMAGTETEWYRTAPAQWRELVAWAAKQLERHDEQFMLSGPRSSRLTSKNLGQLLFCHATPRNDTEIFTRLTSESKLLKVFEGMDATLVVCGHPHMQFDRRVGATRVVNAGSVGMPFGDPGAFWLLLDSRVQFRHTTYDLEDAARRIRGTAFPNADAFATRHVL